MVLEYFFAKHECTLEEYDKLPNEYKENENIIMLMAANVEKKLLKKYALVTESNGQMLNRIIHYIYMMKSMKALLETVNQFCLIIVYSL